MDPLGAIGDRKHPQCFLSPVHIYLHQCICFDGLCGLQLIIFMKYKKNPITLHLGLLPLKATLKGNRMVQNLCHVGACLKALAILDQIIYASSWYSLLIVPVCRCAVVCSRWEEMEKDVHFGLTLPPVRVCPLWVDPSPAWTRTSFMDSPLNTK